MSNNIEQLYNLFLMSTGISTDTRRIQKGNIFIALKGDNFNGNEYAKRALDAGASYCVIDDRKYKVDEHCVVVEDGLRTLQDLAHHHRKQLVIPIIAICGSNGKTTTKELTGAVLLSTYPTFVTQGNLNNHIGVPLSLLSITGKHEIAVIEIGANHIGETTFLCEIVNPNFGLITNNGKDHLEGYGSIEMVIKGNGEFYDYIRKSGGHVFVSAAQQDLMTMSSDLSRTVYGMQQATIKGKIETGDFVKVKIDVPDENEVTINTQLVGDYNFENIMAAVTIGNYFKVPTHKIKRAIESYLPGNNRSQLIQRGSNKIIVDCYNANPSSMELAIKNLVKYNENKILIMGDMYELGSYSADEHKRILRIASEHKIEHIWTVGEAFKHANDELQLAEKVFRDTKEAQNFLTNNEIRQSVILLKASRAIGLEQIIDFIK